ncbi:MAG: hypothetical protein IKC40_01850 [Oscillospiraceae bacterium]|nr:hypothetical protein [Oscillospiraceae bacterium]
MKITRITAAFSALLFFLNSAPLNSRAWGDDRKFDYLALGDSISTGCMLADPDTEGFVSIITEEIDYEVTNAAVNGMTSAQLHDLLSTGNLDEAIMDAELITITCGGNDLMALFYEQVAFYYNKYNSYRITVDDVAEGFAGESYYVTKYTLMPYAMQAVNGFPQTEAFAERLSEYTENLTEIMEYLRQRNSEAEIIVATQYNPYKPFDKVKSLRYVHTNMDEGAKMLSDEIIRLSESLDYTVADVYTAFDKSDKHLSNVVTDMDNLNLDYHPNAAGHAVIAETILSVASLPETPPQPDVVGYLYEFTDKSDAFFFADDSALFKVSDVIDEAARYKKYSDGSIDTEKEIITDMSGISFPEMSPALLYSPGNFSYDLEVIITDEYGTQALDNAVSVCIGLRGDADMNGSVNAVDAAKILVAAAAAGAGNNDAAEQDAFAAFLANVDGIGDRADAADAAYVLTYAAIAATGGITDWQELLDTIE